MELGPEILVGEFNLYVNQSRILARIRASSVWVAFRSLTHPIPSELLALLSEVSEYSLHIHWQALKASCSSSALLVDCRLMGQQAWIFSCKIMELEGNTSLVS